MGLLDAIRAVRSRTLPPPPSLLVDGRKILLVYLFPRLGDSLLLAPIVDALLGAGAKPPMGLLLRASAARIWKHVDLPARVHVLPDILARRPEPGDEEALGEALKLAVTLRKCGYAIAADLTARDDVDARLWLERSEAPVRLGFLGPGEIRPEALTWGALDERHHALEHWTRYLAAPLAPLPLGPLPTEVRFSLSEKDADRAAELWGPHPRVLVVPGAASEEKRLPPEIFRAGGELALARGGSVVVAGSPDERPLVRSLGKALGAGASTYANKSLGPLIQLIRSADVVLTNDTGPMHIAFLSARRTLALFSTMSAPCWGPMRTDPRFVTLTVPAQTAPDVRPVVERLVREHLSVHLDALETGASRCVP